MDPPDHISRSVFGGNPNLGMTPLDAGAQPLSGAQGPDAAQTGSPAPDQGQGQNQGQPYLDPAPHPGAPPPAQGHMSYSVPGHAYAQDIASFPLGQVAPPGQWGQDAGGMYVPYGYGGGSGFGGGNENGFGGGIGGGNGGNGNGLAGGGSNGPTGAGPSNYASNSSNFAPNPQLTFGAGNGLAAGGYGAGGYTPGGYVPGGYGGPQHQNSGAYGGPAQAGPSSQPMNNPATATPFPYGSPEGLESFLLSPPPQPGQIGGQGYVPAGPAGGYTPPDLALPPTSFSPYAPAATSYAEPFTQPVYGPGYSNFNPGVNQFQPPYPCAPVPSTLNNTPIDFGLAGSAARSTQAQQIPPFAVGNHPGSALASGLNAAPAAASTTFADPGAHMPLDHANHAERLSAAIRGAHELRHGAHALNPNAAPFQPQSPGSSGGAGGNGTVIAGPSTFQLAPGAPREMTPGMHAWYAGEPAPESATAAPVPPAASVALAGPGAPALAATAATAATVDAFLGPDGASTAQNVIHTPPGDTGLESNGASATQPVVDIPPGGTVFRANTPGSDSPLSSPPSESPPDHAPPTGPPMAENETQSIASEAEPSSAAVATLDPRLLCGPENAFAPVSASAPRGQGVDTLFRLRDAFRQQMGGTSPRLEPAPPFCAAASNDHSGSTTYYSGNTTSNSEGATKNASIAENTNGSTYWARVLAGNAQLAAVGAGAGGSTSGGSRTSTWATGSHRPNPTLKVLRHSYEDKVGHFEGKVPRTVDPKCLAIGTAAMGENARRRRNNAARGASGPGASPGSATPSNNAAPAHNATPADDDAGVGMQREPSGSSRDADGSTDDEDDNGHNFRAFRAEILNSATPSSTATLNLPPQTAQLKRVVRLTPEAVLKLAKVVAVLPGAVSTPKRKNGEQEVGVKVSLL